MKINGGQVRKRICGAADRSPRSSARLGRALATASQEPPADIPVELDQFRSESTPGRRARRRRSRPTTRNRHPRRHTWRRSPKGARLTFDAGWERHGWPERVGGLGLVDSPRVMSEALTDRATSSHSGVYSNCPRVLWAAVITFRPGPRSAAMFAVADGAVTRCGCQGSRRPRPGANLGALTCQPPSPDDGWRVTVRRWDQPWPQSATALRACDPQRHAGVGAPRHHPRVVEQGPPPFSPGITPAP